MAFQYSQPLSDVSEGFGAQRRGELPLTAESSSVTTSQFVASQYSSALKFQNHSDCSDNDGISARNIQPYYYSPASHNDAAGYCNNTNAYRYFNGGREISHPGWPCPPSSYNTYYYPHHHPPSPHNNNITSSPTQDAAISPHHRNNNNNDSNNNSNNIGPGQPSTQNGCLEEGREGGVEKDGASGDYDITQMIAEMSLDDAVVLDRWKMLLTPDARQHISEKLMCSKSDCTTNNKTN